MKMSHKSILFAWTNKDLIQIIPVGGCFFLSLTWKIESNFQSVNFLFTSQQILCWTLVIWKRILQKYRDTKYLGNFRNPSVKVRARQNFFLGIQIELENK